MIRSVEKKQIPEPDGVGDAMDQQAKDAGSTNSAQAAMLSFALGLSADLKVRDVRAAALLIALAGRERSITTMEGLSVQHLAARVGGGEEVVRHQLRTLMAQNLVNCCGRVQRTHLFRLTDDADRKLRDLFLAVYTPGGPVPPH